MMKRFILILTLILALTSAMALAEPVITVSGTGETQVSADTAVISLGVSAQNKEVLTAQQEVNESIAAIRQALLDSGIESENINTDYMNIYAIYDHTSSEEQVTAYNANSTLAVKVTDMDKVGALIDAAFAAGANTLNGIAFSASDTESAQAESLRIAVADAKAKAEVLAEAAGLKITGIQAAAHSMEMFTEPFQIIIIADQTKTCLFINDIDKLPDHFLDRRIFLLCTADQIEFVETLIQADHFCFSKLVAKPFFQSIKQIPADQRNHTVFLILFQTITVILSGNRKGAIDSEEVERLSLDDVVVS